LQDYTGKRSSSWVHTYFYFGLCSVSPISSYTLYHNQLMQAGILLLVMDWHGPYAMWGYYIWFRDQTAICNYNLMYFLIELKIKQWNQVWNLNLSITYFFRKNNKHLSTPRREIYKGTDKWHLPTVRQWAQCFSNLRSKSISTFF
jgi:hypothetical protein